jgi:redox-sensitive bicupin YhaK (pirin superfamily)
MKKLLHAQRSDTPHMVGDGFPVRSLFSYHDLNVSPFLLLDYAGPSVLEASNRVKGVGQHPHRGFETVTIVYSGEVEHKDSSGGGGIIGPGDVQWMTAASGIVHQEMFTKDFSTKGGPFEFVQLWINLPAKDKKAPPRYQGLQNQNIPNIKLQDGQGNLRVIAGEFEGTQGPAETFTPVNVWDIQLKKGMPVPFKMPKGFTTVVFVKSGSVKVDSGEVIGNAEIGVLDWNEEDFTLIPESDTKLLILGGKPISEPVVGYGPFVMNTTEEVGRAFKDYERL